MFGFFIIRKLSDISCISDHVQSFQNHSLAECGHFVVTWSVQEYSCGHLVCVGIFMWATWSVQEYSCGHLVFMWSLGLCRNIHVVTWSV